MSKLWQDEATIEQVRAKIGSVKPLFAKEAGVPARKKCEYIGTVCK